MKIEPYDFRKPGRKTGEVEQRLDRWLRDFCTLAADQWAKHLAFRTEATLQGLEVVRSDTALGQLPYPAVAYRIVVSDAATPTLFVLPRPLALVLVAGLLGETSPALSDDRELTIVEESLAEYFLRHLLFPVLQDTWRGSAPPSFAVQSVEPNPRFARLFAPGSDVVVCTFVLRGPFGDQPCTWLVPQRNWLEPSEPATPTAQVPVEPARRAAMEPIVREMPVELVVLLDTMDLLLSQVARLRAGDLLVLKQPIDEPLTTLVAGEKRFRVWPGQVGTRKAVEIESLVG